MRNTGSEAIVVGTTTSPLLLSVKDSQGEVVGEFSLGGFPFTIDPKQASSFTIEIPAPSERGSCRLALRITERGETSPPCVVQITPARVGGGQSP